MMSPFFRNRESLLYLLAFLTLYIISVLVNLGTLEFAGEEPRRAMISLEMLSSNNFIRPTQYGWDYYNKPPFFNWILVVVIWITGSASEFVLRLPSLCFYLLMAFVHYKVSSRFFPRTIALLSAFFLLTCADVYTYGLAYGAEIDIFYSFVVYLQAISLFWFYTKKQYSAMYLISYFFCAIGFLTKAFPSLLFQAFTLAALCVYAKSFRPLFRWQHLLGIGLFTLVVGSYFFVYSAYSSPVRFLINLLNEALIKSGVGDKSARLLEKAITYPWLFVKMFAPWSFFLLLLLKRVNYRFRQNPLVWFSALFIFFNIWVYWLTGQPKIRYVYMFLPFGCTILTQIYYRFTKEHPTIFNRILKYTGFIFLVPLLVIIVFPFVEQASPANITVLAISFGILLYLYKTLPAKRIWWFLGGFMLLRLVYAALFIPVQRKGIESYNEHVLQVVKASPAKALQYWADASIFPVSLNTKLFTYKDEEIKMPATLPLEIPYYYYRHTGEIIRFDTTRRQNACFISYASQLNNRQVDTLYMYHDRNLDQKVIFFRLKEAAAPEKPIVESD